MSSTFLANEDPYVTIERLRTALKAALHDMEEQGIQDDPLTLDTAFDALQKRLEDFENERNILMDELRIAKEAAIASASNSDLRAKKEKSKEKLFSLGRSLSSKDSLLKPSNSDKLLTEIETLKVENQALKSDASGHFSEVNQLKAEIQSLTSKLQEFESKRAQTLAEFNNFRKELMDMSARNRELEDMLTNSPTYKRATGEIEEEYQRKIQNLEQNMHEWTIHPSLARFEQLTLELDQLKMKNMNLEKQSSMTVTLEQMLQELKDENQLLAAEVNQLKSAKPLKTESETLQKETQQDNKFVKRQMTTAYSPAPKSPALQNRSATVQLKNGMKQASTSEVIITESIEDLENELRPWLMEITGDGQFETESLVTLLKDGIVLCNIINKVKGKDVLKPVKGKFKYMHLENISLYLAASETLGIDKKTRFEPNDLYEGQGLKKVYYHLVCVKRLTK